jgi:NADH-quinone oxidoreductase subunit G
LPHSSCGTWSSPVPKCKVNGVEVEFEPGMTTLQAAELAGQ